jgi:hypothetical protein
MANDRDLMAELERVAAEEFDGHLTVMRFTTNWRVGFGTPMARCDVTAMPAGATFEEAAEKALASRFCCWSADREKAPEYERSE